MSTPTPGPAPSAPQRNRISRAMRAAVAELFGLVEPAAAPAAPAPRRVARSAFHAAETTRFNLDWRTGNAAADDDIRGAMMTLRGRARDLAYNNPYIERFLGLLLSNVIGPDGVGHQAQVRFPSVNGQLGELDEATNDIIEAGWREYCRSPVTVDGKHTFRALQGLQLEGCAIAGEAFTRTIMGRQFPFGLGLQPIDPDLVAENYNWNAGPDANEVRLGVEMDPDGRPVAYHVWDWPQYVPGSKRRGLRRVPADELLHHYRSRRVWQTRGVTWIARVMQDIQDLGGYDEAVILGARAGANQMAFTQWKDPLAASPPDQNDPNARKPATIDLAPLTVTELDPGLEVVPFDPNQPSGVYSDFTKTVLRRIANGLNLSYASLSNDLREVNYSSTKVGLQAEREMWKDIQAWWIESSVGPIYVRWIQAATLSGALTLPNPDWRAYTAVKWSPRTWPWVEPQREVGATRDMIALGLTSLQRVQAQVGDGDWRRIIEERAQELAFAREKGVVLEDPAAPSSSAPAATPAEPDEDDATDPAAGADAATARSAARANRVAALERNGHSR